MATRCPTALAVFAHPDDEVFSAGILANLAEREVRVTLACATAGEAGKIHPSLGRVDDLGAVRTAELACSCRRLGIEPPVFLGFHDSARKDRLRRDDPRALANVDMLEVEGLKAVLESVAARPAPAPESTVVSDLPDSDSDSFDNDDGSGDGDNALSFGGSGQTVTPDGIVIPDQGA